MLLTELIRDLKKKKKNLAHAHFERIFGGEIEFFSTVLDTNYATENDLNPNKIAK